jgi:UDP-3-O-[3-hydroxymyristoyl] glucosamine N-acyltransferase
MFETTRIGEGTKIDNLVMIGHNNQIGRHNLLCGQVGIAGSCKTGDYVVMAGQAGIKDKTQIGDRVTVGAQAGVHRSIPDGQAVLGSPAVPVREQRRLFQMIARLPEMHRQLRELAAQVEALSAMAAQRPDALADLTCESRANSATTAAITEDSYNAPE